MIQEVSGGTEKRRSKTGKSRRSGEMKSGKDIK